MSRYRCKPVEVDAILLADVRTQMEDKTAPPWVLDAWAKEKFDFVSEHTTEIKTLEGKVYANNDAWLVRGQLGEIWPVQNSQFHHKYEPVEEEDPFSC